MISNIFVDISLPLIEPCKYCEASTPKCIEPEKISLAVKGFGRKMQFRKNVVILINKTTTVTSLLKKKVQRKCRRRIKVKNVM